MMDFDLQGLEKIEDEVQKSQYLIFNLDTDYYGIDIKNVTEIIGIEKITPVPELPDYVKGIISLRGKIIPVIDVRTRFKMSEIEYNDRTCVIIVDLKGIAVGLIVDGVSEVLSFSENDIVPPPGIGSNERNKYLMGIGKVGSEVRLLIDCDELLNDEETDKLIKINKQ